MKNHHGDFVWYELATEDLAGAEGFYSGLLGWEFIAPGIGQMDYRMFKAGASGIGGAMALTDEMKANGAQPLWAAYIGVDDVDATAVVIARDGGTVLLAPFDIPDVGRVAMAQGPDGELFYIMRSASDAMSDSFSETDPKVGHCAWNELMTSDQKAAQSFYTKVFGWQLADTMDMGPMGAYHLYKPSGDRDFLLSGVMQRPAEMPVSMWAHYFRVADIDVAVEFIKGNGGTVLMEPMEIPGDSYSVNAIDPQGAAFSIVGVRS